MANPIAELFVVIGAKTDPLKKDLDSATKKMQDFGKIAGAAMTGVGLAGLKMVDSARKINAELGQTALTMGVTTKEMRDLALSVTNVTFPLESVTKTFDLLARAGIKDTEILKATANAFDALADATGSSAEVVADILIPAYKVFGEELPKTSADLDKFTWLAKNTTVELSEFGSVMSYVAQYGEGLGVTLDDMVAIMAALESKGKSGATATKIFRTAVTQAASGTVTFNEALGLTQEEIDGFKAKMGDATGITDEYAKVANEQFGIMDKIKQKFSELTLKAGSFLTPLEPVLAGMTALGPAMMFFSTAAGTAAIKTALHTTALIAHKVALIAGAVAIKIVTAAQWLWNVAMSANPIGLIILGIAALIAIGVLLWKNWDKISAKAREIWDGIVKLFKNVWGNITNVFKEHWDKILAAVFPFIGIPILIVRNWDKITGFFREIGKNIAGVFQKYFGAIVEIFTAFRYLFMGNVEDWLSHFIHAIKTLFGDKIGDVMFEIILKFLNAWTTITGIFKQHWDKILAILFPPVGIPILIARHWGAIVTFFTNMWEGIKNVFKSAINFLIGLAEGWANSFIRGINAIIGGLNQISVTLPDWMGGGSFGINIPNISEIALPRLKEGGIITKETALIAGERGTEVIMPLDRLQPAPIIIHNHFYVDGEELAEKIDRRLDRRARIQQPL